MNIFDIMGPVMVGPSSSHTAGVVRIGHITQSILGGIPKRVNITFHGSFAKTYKGHGSDKAVIAGLLGYMPHDLRIKDSFALAQDMGMEYSFDVTELEYAHPNTVLIHAETDEGKVVNIQAASIGGGRILVQRINNIEVSYDGQYDTLVIIQRDTPGVISLITNVLMIEHINIAQMRVYRSSKGGDAITTIEADQALDVSLAALLEMLPNIIQVTLLKSAKS